MYFLRLIAIFIILLFAGNSFAKIIILGNQRTDTESIQSIIADINLESGNILAINQALKNLYQSDLFLDVKISQQDDDIIIKLTENPIILDIKFANNDEIDDEVLQSEISLQKGGFYSKDRLKSDIKRINDIYIKSGRFLAKIEPKIIQQKENRIEIIFDINEGDKAKIAKINIIGNKNFSDQDLLDQITTKQSRWYKIFGTNDNYDSDRVEFDKEVLRRFYTSRGYADFEVISAIAQIAQTKDRFFISFLLSEGIKYNFGTNKVINNIRDFDTKLLEEKIDLKEGRVYNAKLVDEVVDKMVKIMSDNGYAFSHIEPILQRDKINNIIDIKFIISQTPRIYINSINISGNSRTKDEVLRRELRITEGDPYNLTKINRSKQRLQNLGFFENVTFNSKRISSDRIDLNIEVSEKKTGELNFGIGYSTIDKLNGNIGIKENNLFGTGQELGINSRISSFSMSNDINYSKPWLFGREIRGGINVFSNEIDSLNTISYDQESEGIVLSASYPILEYINHQISYSYQNSKISDIDSTSIVIQELIGSYSTSAISHNISLDKRDNRLKPTSGYYLNLSQKRAGLGGDIRFLKNEITAGYYVPLINDDWVLKFLAKYGHIDGIGQDVRINDNFFLGGFNFRGFEYAGIGPRVQNNDGSYGDAVGGKSYYMGTLEFKFPTGLPKEIGINTSLFLDAGTVRMVDNAIKSSSNIIDDGAIRSSYGLSLTWSSPLGPIRLDFAKIIKQEEYDETEGFRFSFGNNF
ncbi:outer membrane protein assembly factor BamA [Rickettsiales bacterium]|nr:outer membrane protein assembly factor BamA [Rickettsiales bacterium]